MKARKGAATTVSGRELAGLAGVSHTAVQGWIAAGLIPVLPGGKIDRAAGLEAARAQLDALGARETDRATLAQVRAELTVARRDRERALARLRELELERETGKYIEREIVERDGANVALVCQSILRSISSRTAMALACDCRSAAVVEKKINDEVERAIGSLANEAIYIGPFTGRTLEITCGRCAEVERREAAQAARLAEMAKTGEVLSWQEALTAALARCLADQPTAGAEIDAALLPAELREGWGSAELFLRNVARVAYEERLAAWHASNRSEAP